MTAQRQQRNGLSRQLAVIAQVMALLAGFWTAFPNPAARASTTERVVVNRFSGLAIEGFDPVAYFTENQPVLGLPDFEAAQAGAVWRFHNEGNRASFMAHPEIYGPQFGGYDPVDVARGVPAIPAFSRLPASGFICSGSRLIATPLRPIPITFCRRPGNAGTIWKRISPNRPRSVPRQNQRCSQIGPAGGSSQRRSVSSAKSNRDSQELAAH
jgi:hypothetical protein